MQITISKKRYHQLIQACDLTSSVLGLLGDMVSDEYKKTSDDHEEFQQYILQFAKEMGYGEKVDSYKDRLFLVDEGNTEFDEILEDYDDYIFWDELATRLGKRDYFATITPEEKESIKKNNGWYTDRVHEIYEKYHKEFEKYGISRLNIDENKK